MYYTSCADSGGATTGVSKRESGQALTPRTYSVVDDWPVRRSKHHALYAKEQAVEYRPGTAFLYSMVRPCTDPLACLLRVGSQQFTDVRFGCAVRTRCIAGRRSRTAGFLALLIIWSSAAQVRNGIPHPAMASSSLRSTGARRIRTLPHSLPGLRLGSARRCSFHCQEIHTGPMRPWRC